MPACCILRSASMMPPSARPSSDMDDDLLLALLDPVDGDFHSGGIGQAAASRQVELVGVPGAPEHLAFMAVVIFPYEGREPGPADRAGYQWGPLVWASVRHGVNRAVHIKDCDFTASVGHH